MLTIDPCSSSQRVWPRTPWTDGGWAVARLLRAALVVEGKIEVSRRRPPGVSPARRVRCGVRSPRAEMREAWPRASITSRTTPPSPARASGGSRSGRRGGAGGSTPKASSTEAARLTMEPPP